MHLRQNFLYSVDGNKNPVELFALPYLTVFFISVSLHAKEKNMLSKKKQDLIISLLI